MSKNPHLKVAIKGLRDFMNREIKYRLKPIDEGIPHIINTLIETGKIKTMDEVDILITVVDSTCVYEGNTRTLIIEKLDPANARAIEAPSLKDILNLV